MPKPETPCVCPPFVEPGVVIPDTLRGVILLNDENGKPIPKRYKLNSI